MYTHAQVVIGNKGKIQLNIKNGPIPAPFLFIFVDAT